MYCFFSETGQESKQRCFCFGKGELHIFALMATSLTHNSFNATQIVCEEKDWHEIIFSWV